MGTEAYNKGYNTGLNWKEDYRPGGLYIPRKPSVLDHKKMAIYNQAIKDHADYFVGFDDAKNKN